MINSIIESAAKAVKRWWLLLIVGLIFMAAGIWVFATPLSSYLTLSTLFSVSFLVSGFCDIAFSISNRKQMKGWGWNLVYGIANVSIGILLISNPLISIATLPVYVGITVLFRSIMVVGTSLDLRGYGVPGAGNLLVMGMMGILFSFILLWNPNFAGLSLVIWTAITLLTAGIYSIYYSFQLKKLNDAGSRIFS
jgi:uncharacterized membrane protein HdeD (DUF308 family)